MQTAKSCRAMTSVPLAAGEEWGARASITESPLRDIRMALDRPLTYPSYAVATARKPKQNLTQFGNTAEPVNAKR
jgi:hypothetical protein